MIQILFFFSLNHAMKLLHNEKRLRSIFFFIHKCSLLHRTAAHSRPEKTAPLLLLLHNKNQEIIIQSSFSSFLCVSPFLLTVPFESKFLKKGIKTFV